MIALKPDHAVFGILAIFGALTITGAAVTARALWKLARR